MTIVSHIRRSTWLTVFVFLLVSASNSLFAQENEPIEGGSITWKGKQYEIPAGEIERHLEIIRGLNPKLDSASQLHEAWCRAIRLTCARAEGIKLDNEKFVTWMSKRHRALRAQLARDPNPQEGLQRWFMGLGFKNLAAYEAACSEEYLGELFVSQEFPEIDTDASLLRARYDDMFTAYEVAAVAFAPETLNGYQPLDPKDEKSKELFRSWWKSLPDAKKKIMDDQDRPAIEAETLYFRFNDKSIDELKELFEKERPEIGGSLKTLTAKYELTNDDLYKIATRWQQKRRGSMSQWNGEVPANSTEEEAFVFIRPHLERIWRLIRYLGDVWQEINNAEGTVDFKELAKKRGLNYRYIPLTPTRLLTGDPELPGDHPLYMRRTKPGHLYSYTSSGDKPGSLYYTNGVVDQPGLHAGVWRLIQAQEMRVRDADEMMATVWDRFELANRWRVTFEQANLLRNELDRQVSSYIAEISKTKKLTPAERQVAEASFAKKNFARFFDPRLSLLKNAKVIPDLFIRPYEGKKISPNYKGPVGVRASNYLKMGWNQIVGEIGTKLEEGQIIPLAFSHERRIGILTQVKKIHRPSDRRWKIDVAGRQAAKLSLEQNARKERIAHIRQTYGFPNIVHKFAMTCKQYDRIMSKSFLDRQGKSLQLGPTMKKPDEK